MGTHMACALWYGCACIMLDPALLPLLLQAQRRYQAAMRAELRRRILAEHQQQRWGGRAASRRFPQAHAGSQTCASGASGAFRCCALWLGLDYAHAWLGGPACTC